jgi:hypothetical protein
MTWVRTTRRWHRRRSARGECQLPDGLSVDAEFPAVRGLGHDVISWGTP